MTSTDSETNTNPQLSEIPSHPPIQNWEAWISDLLPALAEAASLRIAQDLSLEYIGTSPITSFEPAGPGLLISLSSAGLLNGSIHLPFEADLACSLADASCYGQADQPDQEQIQVLDEARAQAVEDLVAVSAQTLVDSLIQNQNIQFELAVSDREHLPDPVQENQHLPRFLSEPAWQISADLILNQRVIGRALVLLPLSLFQSEEIELEEDDNDGLNIKQEEMAALVADKQSGEQETKAANEQETAQKEPAELDSAEPAQEEAPAEPEAETSPAAEPAKETSKARTVNIHILQTTLLHASYQVEEELGGLLGESFELYDYLSRIISKQDFLSQFQSRVIVTNLAVSGDKYGTAFSVMTLSDAITLGGTLIMLPQDEISKKIKSGQLREDEEDAFGEVINILTGAYSHAFGEFFPSKLRLKKDRMSNVAPTKVDISSLEPFPDAEYFLASYQMRLGNQSLDQMHILIPPDLVSMSMQDVENLKKNPSSGTSGQASAKSPGTIHIQGQVGGGGQPAIAVISEDSQQAQFFSSSLEAEGVELIKLKVRDKMRERLQSYNVLGAFLVLKKIDDKSLASLIKVRSMLKGRCPLIIAGPEWTKAKVLQAVRYGVKDILTTPADPAQVVEKTHKHMLGQAVQ